MSTIKLNELAESDINLSDLIAKSDSNGLMTRTNIEKLATYIGAISTSGIKGAIESTSATPSEDGLYPCTESGTYTNFGGEVVDISGQVVFISVSESQTVFTQVVIPLNVSQFGLSFDNLTDATNFWNLQNSNGNTQLDGVEIYIKDLLKFYKWDSNVPDKASFSRDDVVIANEISKGNEQVAKSGDVFDFAISKEGTKPFSKNIADKRDFVSGSYYSPSSNIISSSPAWRRTGFIPVTEGKTYTLSGIGVSSVSGGFFTNTDFINGVQGISTFTFTVPTGLNIEFVAINITNNSATTIYDDTVQLELGSSATSYEPYSDRVVFEKDSILGVAVTEVDLYEQVVGKNKINLNEVGYIKRYSTSTKTFTNDTLGIASSGFIPVTEGEFYAFSGDGAYSINAPQGGYFNANTDTVAIDNMTFQNPVSGSGKIFQVPLGQNINFVVLSLKKLNSDASETSLDGDVQLEEGEKSTSYEPYEVSELIKESLLPSSEIPTADFDISAWLKYTEGEEKTNVLNEKAPVFRNHWLKKDKDLTIINLGTSLTARSIEHCTEQPKADERPPLMHSFNMASILWDKMSIGWNQKYRRYDYSGYFTEVGTFITASNVSEWDDNIYRSGLTRYSDTSNAGVSFEIPVNAWQFNFIYRSDTLASQDVDITVSEGNGVLEVFNGSAWVEANGYNFSMRESTPTTRIVSVPNASTDIFSDKTIATKGNTTYQKRLKMRCKSDSFDSRASVKNVSIDSNNSDRFLYWGVEYSEREYMLTYINSARGSYNTQADSVRGLPLVADNEVHEFKPDLLFFELPIHNDGAASAGSYAPNIWERLTNNYVFRADYELSLKTRSSFYNYTPEIIMFNSSISYNFGGIDEEGNLILGEQSSGKMMTALDKFNEAYNWVLENHPEVGFINSVQRWVNAGYSIFGDLKTATLGSGKSGNTFSNEGSHWNNTGSKIIAKTLTGIFENI